MKKITLISLVVMSSFITNVSYAEGNSHTYTGAYGGTISGSWHNDNGVGGRHITATGPNGRSKSFSSSWDKNAGTYSRTGTRTGRYGRSVSRTKTWRR